MIERTIQVGLIGYGFSGNNIHSRLIAATPGLALNMIRDRNTLSLPGETFRRVDHSDGIINNPQIDLVVIATPNAAHFPLAKAALLAGKHVVVDKPFTITLAEAEELAALAQRQQRVLCAFQNRRWDSDFLTVSQLITESNVLGDVRYFESNYTFYQPDIKPGWREKKEPGAGVWFDLGAHLIDQMLQLFGEPLDGIVNMDVQRHAALSPDFFHALFIYPSLRVVLHGSLLSAAEPPRFTINGTEGSYVKYGQDAQENALVAGVIPGSAGWGKDERPGTLSIRRGNALETRTLPAIAGNYPAFYAQMRDAVLGQGKPPVPVSDALRTMRVIENTRRLGCGE